ncbi:hypothetical protein QRX50_37155 [Amycolatopsis carbonis]|uniref:Uncharacterized protein n=1 Tax=Amycolatopsis carbonis TaxID=715471 RepID=A0A9Y2IBF5_9PSEU|nr:hypothetical protein [Amycolatopsis sp. 2-15]WIX77002.1 hypothetical protein QRX50_37155 [Amycolatopsis sp. 2-15]
MKIVVVASPIPVAQRDDPEELIAPSRGRYTADPRVIVRAIKR